MDRLATKKFIKKSTWKDAQKACFDFGGGLVKIDNYYQHLFLIRFLEVSGVKKEGIDVSTIELFTVGITRC